MEGWRKLNMFLMLNWLDNLEVQTTGALQLCIKVTVLQSQIRLRAVLI